MRDEPGFDMVAQGYSGIMSLCGQTGDDYQRVGISIGDINAGLHAYMAIVTALYAREKTGRGTYIDISLLDCLFSLLSPAIADYLNTGRIDHPSGNSHPAIAPFGVIKTLDGAVIVAVLGEKLWRSFCAAIGRSELADDTKFSTNEERLQNRDDLRKIIRPLIATRTTGDWMSVFHKEGVPCAVVNNIKQACEMEQIKERNMLWQAGDYKLVGNPLKLSQFEVGQNVGKVPNPGEDTEKIRKEFPMDQAST